MITSSWCQTFIIPGVKSAGGFQCHCPVNPVEKCFPTAPNLSRVCIYMFLLFLEIHSQPTVSPHYLAEGVGGDIQRNKLYTKSQDSLYTWRSAVVRSSVIFLYDLFRHIQFTLQVASTLFPEGSITLANFTGESIFSEILMRDGVGERQLKL